MEINSDMIDYQPMRKDTLYPYVKWMAYVQLFQFISTIVILILLLLTFSYTSSQLNVITSAFVNTTQIINEHISKLSPQVSTFFSEGTTFINTTKPLAIGLTKCVTSFCH